MTTLRPIALALVVGGLIAAGCTSADSTSTGDEPLPTIGLDSDLGIDPNVQAIGAENIDTVVMIGDSITLGSRSELEAAFESLGFTEPVIASFGGKRMVEGNLSGAETAQVLIAEDGELDDDRANELWIVALGTNDIGQYRPDMIAAAVNEMLANVPEDAPLVWVDTYFRDVPDGADEVNEIIVERVGRRGNAVVARWSFFAAGDGVLTIDGVHPTSSGSVVFAAVVAETASRFLGR